jgi:hypothetical protein
VFLTSNELQVKVREVGFGRAKMAVVVEPMDPEVNQVRLEDSAADPGALCAGLRVFCLRGVGASSPNRP